MCGINGVWNTDGKAVDSNLFKFAARLQAHRGPDDEGFLWIDTRASRLAEGETADFPADLALGFRRLAILDLSPAGHQPMQSQDGSLWIVFNGEIYNYIELRAELQSHGYRFRSGTDTEVVLAAYAEWGVSCLERFNGMWAFALWDNRQRRLFCARDRFGIKPFHYTWQDGAFAFGSEIKTILPFCSRPLYPNQPLVYDFLVYGLLDHTSETFFAGIHQLPPASYMFVMDGRQTVVQYWRPDPNALLELPSADAYAERFRELFEDAVRIHLRSDVSVGTCLSGGLDSSAIVCVANRLLLDEHALPADLVGEQQKTFSSCFEDPRFDERPFIEQVLSAANAEANYVFPSASQLVETLPRLIWHQEQPIFSTSVFAQWRVMERVAERGVRVLLDGQGGDELFGGYHQYFHYFWSGLLKKRRWRALWNEVRSYRRAYPLSFPHTVFLLAKGFMPPPWVRWLRQFKREGVSLGALGLSADFVHAYSDRARRPPFWKGDLFEDYLFDSLVTSSLPSLLRYEDRNSMAHSVEARVPFLDARLVEFALALPPEQKIQDALTKIIMRNGLRDVLPEKIRLRRDKMGFETPEKTWLNAELGKMFEEIIHSVSFAQRGYFDLSKVQEMFAAHKAGRRDLSFTASRWLSLELWLRQFIDGATPQPSHARFID